ncbi:tRNA (34-2'-O)-methyltransferase regulator WDR6-like protein [Drosera capensis]
MEEKAGEWRLEGGDYLGEISALCFLHLPSHFSPLPLLLAGTGSQIILFDVNIGRMVKFYRVFEGIHVHGISSFPIHRNEGTTSSAIGFNIVVFGERRVKLFTLHFDLVEVSQEALDSHTNLVLMQVLPKFSHWVLDACFLEDGNCSCEDRHGYLAVGCSDNSLHIWNIKKFVITLVVKCSERCLLYSMRLWGHTFEALQVASGTIFNEIVLWKVANQSRIHSAVMVHGSDYLGGPDASNQFDYHQCDAAVRCRLTGHQGSILGISWSADGSKLISVSDDRSARVWIDSSHNGSDNFGLMENYSVGPVLFGHSARIWDCCIFDFVVVTAGEDCTCRIWGLHGQELWMTKEHVGRGVWRCLFDPRSSLLVTAGFDSAIKVHCLHASISRGLMEFAEEVRKDRDVPLVLSIPNSSANNGLMDSKTEYVRSLRFACGDTIYVAMNHGYVYHIRFPGDGNAERRETIKVGDGWPIVCMDLLPTDLRMHSAVARDWLAVGDGKGVMTVIIVSHDNCSATVCSTISWKAEMDRQLLGAYWCKSLGCRFIFTSDPSGILKLWRLAELSESSPLDSTGSYDVHLVAEYMSSLGARIMCLDALVEEEVLVCGDLRGNLLVFDMSKALLCDGSQESGEKMPPVSYFKGAHGISTVSSLSLAGISPTSVEICSVGGDGCICYLEYDKCEQAMEFVGMKQVKELSLIQSVTTRAYPSHDCLVRNYAVGFSSVDFMIWNLQTETMVLQVKCGGWRRPYSYFLGRVPETDCSFAFVKDDLVYVHRHKVPDGEKSIPRNLHLQFHGREIHSLCFIPDITYLRRSTSPKSIWIATGCEDGTVRLTRYTHGSENWSTSKLLGEHVGGSAVRSLCFVSKIHAIERNVSHADDDASRDDVDNSFLLISVGAKRILTTWLLKTRQPNEESASNVDKNHESNALNRSTGDVSSMSFKWLSTDMPKKSVQSKKISNSCSRSVKLSKPVPGVEPDLVNKGEKLKFFVDTYDDDWRYLAVTAFHVKISDLRISICFTVVACSDATLTLRALVLPHRFWFDVASLVPLSSPVLALHHVVIPFQFFSEGHWNLYFIISGSTDGSIAFWDISERVEAFIQRVSSLQLEKSMDFQRRPRTGRGSQGGRWWRSMKGVNGGNKLHSDSTAPNNEGDSTKDAESSSSTKNTDDNSVCYSTTSVESEVQLDNSSTSIFEVMPLNILNNVHQSGVNCLHVSEIGDCLSIEKGFVCHVVSGGDDQALAFIHFYVEPSLTTSSSPQTWAGSEARSLTSISGCCVNKSYSVRCLYEAKVASAHSSAVKGIWTDGKWVFSVGLDQRVRCWQLEEPGKLTEHSHFIVSVSEPEALDAKAVCRDRYEIVVAGRGMQVVEFFQS